MRKETSIKVGSFILSAISIPAAVTTSCKLSETQSAVENDPNYKIARGLSDVINNLNEAKDSLSIRKETDIIASDPYGNSIFTTETHYPNPNESKKSIKETSTQIDFLLNNQQIENQLRDVYGSLPQEDEVKNYKGEDVNDSTFESQRQIIDGVKTDIEKIREYYDKQAPGEKRAFVKWGVPFTVSMFGVFTGVPLFIWSKVNFRDRNR